MEQVLHFLSGLAENNTREWFTARKKQYEAAKSEVETFVNRLIPEIGRFDPSVQYVEAKDCLFRIFRDVRFSKDKSPYKTNMGAWITRAGRKSPGPGYYVHLQPGGSFLAAGIYMPDPVMLKKIRSEIYYNAEEFKSLMQKKPLRTYAVGLSDFEKTKLPPRDFPRDFPDIDLLKYKHYTLAYHLTDRQVTSDDFLELAAGVFRAWEPFNAFLRRAVDE